MKLVINEFGTYLSKKENRFVVKTKEKQEEYSADDVEQIIIASPSSFSEGVVKLAIEKNIDIVFTSFLGKPFARIYPCTLGGTTLTRREQAKAYFNEKGVQIVKRILEAKIKNQLFLLKRLSKTRNSLFEQEIVQLEKNLEKFENLKIEEIDKSRDVLLGHEGNAAAIYFSCLTKIIDFKRREPEAKDIFNITLNYGYGMLYSEVERACVIAGLDPYLGFLHMDRYGKPCMVLDLVEQFRPIVDRAIINLFVYKKISEEDLEKIGEATLLTKKGREKIINEVLKQFSAKLKIDKKKISVDNLILEQAREIVRFLLGQSETYKPFIWSEKCYTG